MTNDERIKRADKARLLLEDPLMVEALEHMDAECWRLFKTFAPTDTEGVMQVKAMQYMATKFAAFLRSVVTDGKMAKLDVERKSPRPSGY